MEKLDTKKEIDKENDINETNFKNIIQFDEKTNNYENNTIYNNLVDKKLTNFLIAGILDSFSFKLILIFFILMLHFINYKKIKFPAISFLYFLGITTANIIIILNKIIYFRYSFYVDILKILFTIFTITVIIKILGDLLFEKSTKKKDINKVLFKLFNNKIIYFLSFIFGFLIMNSQINSPERYLFKVAYVLKSNQLTFAQGILSILIYSFGVSLLSILYGFFRMKLKELNDDYKNNKTIEEDDDDFAIKFTFYIFVLIIAIINFFTTSL